MKKCGLFLLLFIVGFSLFGQNKKDSIIQARKEALAQNELGDYVKLTLELATIHSQNAEIDNLLLVFEEGLAATKNNPIKDRPRLLFNYLFQKSFYKTNLPLEDRITLMDSAAQVLLTSHDSEDFKIRSWFYVQGSLAHNGAIEKANRLHREIIKLASKKPDVYPDVLMECYRHRAVYEMNRRQYSEALSLMRSAIESSKDAKNAGPKVSLFLDNAMLLRTMGMKGADESIQRAYDIGQEGEPDFYTAISTMALAEEKIKREAYDDAMKLFLDARKYFEGINEVNSTVTVDVGLAKIYAKQGKFEKVEALYDSLFIICNQRYFTECRNIYSDYVDVNGENLSFQQKDSIYQLQIIFSKKREEVKNLAEVWSLRSDNAYQAGDYKKAIDFARISTTLNDSLNIGELQSKVAREQALQDVDRFQYEKERAELQSKVLEQQNQLFFSILIGLMSLFVLGAYFYRRLSASKRKISNQKLELEQLNETKDKFFGIIAHDIRSPIAALGGIGEQMDFYLKKGDEKKLNRLTQRVDNTSNRLSRLLDNLLNWALLQKGTIPYHPENVPLSNVIEENIALFSPLATTKEVVIENYVPKETFAYTDNSAASTVVRNLLNNAVKFTSKGDTISFSSREEKDKIWVSIKDTGTGMSEKKLNALFGLEVKSKKGTAGEKGTGLGLVLVKELLELNKGGIEVKSKEGQGSEFSFYFPKSKNNI